MYVINEESSHSLATTCASYSHWHIVTGVPLLFSAACTHSHWLHF